MTVAEAAKTFSIAAAGTLALAVVETHCMDPTSGYHSPRNFYGCSLSVDCSEAEVVRSL